MGYLIRKKCNKILTAVFFLLLASVAMSCDWSKPGSSGNDVKEVYQEGVDKGYSDGRSQKEKDPDNDYSGNARIVYNQGYNAGYAKGFEETEHEASGNDIQEASFDVSKSYGHLTYEYTFNVFDGKVTWSFKGTGGSKKGSFSCNKDVPTSVVCAELSGLAYWRIACSILEAIATRDNTYTSGVYIRHAKDALTACTAQLIGVQGYCPNASQLPETCLDNLRSNEGDEESEYSAALSLANTARNLTPEVCHLHGVDF